MAKTTARYAYVFLLDSSFVPISLCFSVVVHQPMIHKHVATFNSTNGKSFLFTGLLPLLLLLLLKNSSTRRETQKDKCEWATTKIERVKSWNFVWRGFNLNKASHLLSIFLQTVALAKEGRRWKKKKNHVPSKNMLCTPEIYGRHSDQKPKKFGSLLQTQKFK